MRSLPALARCASVLEGETRYELVWDFSLGLLISAGRTQLGPCLLQLAEKEREREREREKCE